LFESVRLGEQRRDPQTLELITLRRADTAGPEQQQVRLEAEQTLDVELAVAPNGRHVRDRRRPFPGIEHADQQVG